MMDQILAGMPQSPPVQPAPRDQQNASGAGATENGDSFQDYVSKAGQQEGQHRGRDDRGNAVDENTSGEDVAPDAATRNASGATIDLIRRNAQDSAESRIRLALLKQTQKANIPAEVGKDADAEKALAKMLEAAKRMAQKVTQDTATMPVTQEAAATPSEELSLLLGLKPTKDASAKTAKHTDRENDKDAKDEKSVAHADRKAEIVLAGAENATTAKNGNSEARAKDTAADEAVRLVSADGKGRPVDIPLSKTDGVIDTDKRSNAAKVDTATVIEARRYLGFSPDVNTTTLTNAIKSDTTWTEALSHVNRAELSLEGNTVTEVNTLKLQMNPGDLGSMVASLKLKGDELTVEVRVDTIEAYRHLSADQDGIVKALQDQGFSIDSVTVQLNPTDRAEGSADRDQTRQGQGQQDAERNQPDGRNDNARQGAQNSWMRDDDAGISTTADGRADSSRTGDIYL